jgi:hypothetical protein
MTMSQLNSDTAALVIAAELECAREATDDEGRGARLVLYSLSRLLANMLQTADPHFDRKRFLTLCGY